MTDLKHGSLFTGIGIFDLACQNNGIKNVFGCDIDPFSQLHYKEHFPDSLLFNDITQIQKVPPVDILTFGFPCQDVSQAGLKIDNPLQNGKRTSLFWEAIRIVDQARPQFVVAENVARLRHNGLYECLQAFGACGYNAGYAILSAAKFGAVHQRERIFIIAHPMRFGRAPIIRVLKKALNHNLQESRKDVFAKFDRNMCIEMERQADSRNDCADYGNAYWLRESLIAKAYGNSIYYPVAEMLIKNIKEELN